MRFVVEPFPRRENRQRLIPQKLCHRDSAHFMCMLKFFVDEGVVESRRCCVRGSASIENSRWPRPVDCAQAHRTGFAGGVKIAARELKDGEGSAGFANSDDFGVGGGIVGRRHAIRTFGEDSPVLGNDRAERAAT